MRHLWRVGGCVSQNLDKEGKFDLMAKDKEKRSLEARGLRSLALKKFRKAAC